MNVPLTHEQEKEVAELVARGLDRASAIVLVLETTEDVIENETTPPPHD